MQMNNEILYIIIFITSVFISSVSQILLKKSANTIYKNKIREYVNYKVIFSYFLFILSTLITLYAYKVVPLSLGPILESTGYIFVTILGVIILDEKINKKKFIGMIIIMVGIVVYSL